MRSKRQALRLPTSAAILGGLAFTVLVSGCLDEKVAGSTGIGNPSQGTVSFAMVAVSQRTPAAKESARGRWNPDGSFSVADLGGTVFTIRSSLANIGHVKFKLPDGIDCSDAPESECEVGDIKVPGPFVADVMAGTLVPDLGAFKVPAGLYRRVEIRLEALEAGKPAPDPRLVGNSMIIAGTFDYAGKSDRAFSLALDFDEEVRFESGTMTVKEDILNKLLLLFNVDEWLASANITKCLEDSTLVLDPQGGLHLNEDNECEGLEQVLKEGVKASGDLEDDHD